MQVVAGALALTLLSGCAARTISVDHGVKQRFTPDQSRAEVVDAATDIVRTVPLKVAQANFDRESCNDQGDPPFRGAVTVFFAGPPGIDESDAEIERMVQRLKGAGWTTDSSFKSHGSVLRKGNVDAIFSGANASRPTSMLELYGQCWDVTTTKAQAATVEHLTFN